MIGRRSFFKRLAQAAAIVALAPQLAFRVEPEKFAPIGVYEQLIQSERMVISEPLDLIELIKTCYEIKRAREANPDNGSWLHYSRTNDFHGGQS